MGLAVMVGVFSEMDETDPEGANWEEEAFTHVNALLAENGLPPHTEPRRFDEPLMSRCALEGYPYSFLHYLRRAYAYRAADPDWMAQPFEEDADPTEDPVVVEQTTQMESHLLCHSDCEGYYVPVDFPSVLFDDEERVPGGMLGSSYRLMEELIAVAPALGIELDGSELPDTQADAINADGETEAPLWIERLVWLSLYEAARLSIKHKAAIIFG